MLEEDRIFTEQRIDNAVIVFADENGENFVKNGEGLLPGDCWATVAFLAAHNPALQEQVIELETKDTLLAKLVAKVSAQILSPTQVGVTTFIDDIACKTGGRILKTLLRKRPSRMKQSIRH